MEPVYGVTRVPKSLPVQPKGDDPEDHDASKEAMSYVFKKEKRKSENEDDQNEHSSKHKGNNPNLGSELDLEG